MRATIGFALLVAGAVQAQDTIRVRGKEVPWSAAKARLTEVQTIGRLDGPPEYAFGAIQSIAVDGKGRMYTFDEKDTQIRAYDGAGKFVRLVGRKGAGPGEYRSVNGLGILGDTLLAVFDNENARISLFQPDGTLARSILQPRMTSQFERGTAATSSGLLAYRLPVHIVGDDRSEVPLNGPPNGATVTKPYVLRLRADGSTLDSIPLGVKQKYSRGFYIIAAGNLSFVPDFHVAVSPSGGAVFGESDQYRFVIRSPDGRVRVVEQSWTPLPLTGAERDNWQEYADYFKRRDPKSPGYVLPKTKPAYRDLIADRDGRVWVSLYAPAEKRDAPIRPDRPSLRWRQNAVYDVFDSEGKHLGRVELKPESRMLWSQGDRVWVLAKGADDEERIVSYRIQWN